MSPWPCIGWCVVIQINCHGAMTVHLSVCYDTGAALVHMVPLLASIYCIPSCSLVLLDLPGLHSVAVLSVCTFTVILFGCLLVVVYVVV